MTTEYEVAIDQIPAPEPDEPDPNDVAAGADAIRVAFLRLMDACGYNPLRLSIAVARTGGLSYREIGRMYGVSQEAVRKHIAAIARRHQAVGKVLRATYPVQPAYALDYERIRSGG